MCQSKAQGGRRCAAHNNKKEHARVNRQLKAAVKRRDLLIDAVEAGTATQAELDAAEHAVLVQVDLSLLTDPKLTDAELEALWEDMSPEVQDAARPVAQEVIEHEKQAAKLAGEAATARMFDRDEQAAEFEDQAEEERSRAAKLADVLRAALTEAKTKMSEGVHDSLAGEDSAVGGGVIGVFRDVARETGQALAEGFAETADAMGEGMVETVDALAEGVGVSPSQPTPGRDQSRTAVVDEPAQDTADTRDDNDNRQTGRVSGEGEDMDNTSSEHTPDVEDGRSAADDEVVEDDGRLVERLKKAAASGTPSASAPPPASASAETQTRPSPAGHGHGQGLAQATAVDGGQASVPSAGPSPSTPATSAPAQRASGSSSTTAGERAVPGTPAGTPVDQHVSVSSPTAAPAPAHVPFPITIPLRGTRVDPRHMDVGELSDAELLAWITALDKELEAV